MIKRCPWPSQLEIMQEYHDKEWGVPVHDDQKHFEFLVMDAFQAGLSWSTILKKRLGFQMAFANFDFYKVALFDSQKVEELITNTDIIRNRQKIEATIKNANAFIKIIEEFGSFDKYIWQFTNNKTIHNNHVNQSDLPSTSNESVLMSKALKKRGFAFVGPTICYAYMQASGMINDHLIDCYRYHELKKS